jgi:DNA-binding NarL/FixJ family response regulator
VTAHVLLVEDEVDARTSLVAAIERADMTCSAACSRKEAVAHARRDTFIDIVVTDVALGNDDRGGLELIAELREAGFGGPLIVITAFADVAKVKFALNAGAAYLLEKPFRAAELLEVMRRLLSTPRDVGHQVERSLMASGLTQKELAVARHLLKGLSSAEIAVLEGNSDKTVRQHITQIYAKCGVSTRGEFFNFVVPT